MLPDVRWVVAGLLATVILVLGGMGLTARLRNAHDLAAAPLQIAPAEPSPWKQAAVSTDQRIIVDVPQRIPVTIPVAPDPDPSASFPAFAAEPGASVPSDQVPVAQDDAAASQAQAPDVAEPQLPILSEDHAPASEDQTGSIGPADVADRSESEAAATHSEPAAAPANSAEMTEGDASVHDAGEQIAVSESDHAPSRESEPDVDAAKKRPDPEPTAAIPAIEAAASAAAPQQEHPPQPEPPAAVTAVSPPAGSAAADAHQQASSQAEASKAATLAKRKARQRRLRRLRAAQQAQQQQQAAAQQTPNPFFELFGGPARTPQTAPSAMPSAPTSAQPRSR